ncbi:MAG TPA: hypothetical protein DDW94_04570 [Deltaproteobacteria bacterium]|nr:MAG: hypothetical protein A2Z79_13025 [Deltaproteobacteria bacterium GWA2_55_82]OGQ62798.1 MAG: hypothetical protein A3I81_11805 [Deltaproteobacteria bacterium RIFCSPLOWO2_02_FULL_55_12]OIJ73518.1 MAG: hypothetical protein A2V21_304095 [Deltaproteobacteria bacterium GWC2_55_46]HBG46248.1 hypothetical protein [Deltaproteobacteria bacterium]HCY10155.1 hypothetical protein [Deltaproteobacteria bacterium]
MSSIKDKLTTMFSKVMAGTVTREEGAMLLNHLAKEDQAGTSNELTLLIDDPPQGVFAKTIVHTIALARNKAFFNIITDALTHKDEDVSIMAAQELARFKTHDAKEKLMEHLDNEIYHVRKASATALVQGFTDGVEIVKKQMLEQREPFYRLTSAQALANAGRKGVEALLNVIGSGDGEAMASAAEALAAAGDDMVQADVMRIFDALMNAGDRKDSRSVIELLKVASSLKGKAKGFEGFIQAFADYPFEPVREEAQNALRKIRS